MPMLHEVMKKLASSIESCLNRQDEMVAIDLVTKTPFARQVLVSTTMRAPLGLLCTKAINEGRGKELVEDLKRIAGSIDQNRLFVESLVPFSAINVEDSLFEKYGVDSDYLKKRLNERY